MSAINDLRRAIADSRARGVDVVEIHANRDLYVAVCNRLMIANPIFPHTPQIDGIPIKVTRHEGTGFHFVVIPKEPSEEPAECAGFRDVDILNRASARDAIVSALREELRSELRSELREETTRVECKGCPCLGIGSSLWEHKCGAGYEIVQAVFPYSFNCGMVAIVTREKSIIFNHKRYD